MLRSTFSLALAAAAVACAPKSTPATVAPAAVEIVRFESDDAGFHTNTWFVDTGEEVVVVDAQFTPAQAELALDALRAHTDRPVSHVVITHPNPDKFNGASVFADEGARVVASDATVAAMPDVHAYKQAYFEGVGAFEPGTYPELVEVDTTFSGTLQLALPSGATLELVELSHPGVARTQTVVRAGEALIVGDLVATDTHAWLEGGIVDGAPQPALGAWTDALDELAGLGGATVYPGRGAPMDLTDAVSDQIHYLDTMDELVADYVADLPEDALATEPDLHWAAITDRAVAAFPDHAHPYLVTYGVYGLAMAHAAR